MEKIISLLKKILSNDSNSKHYIFEFQKEVLETDEEFVNEEIDDLLSKLAFNLSFFEPDPEMRKEDPSYYGEEKLRNYIEPVLKKISDFNNK
ncbi:MAG TPA: hypothetical protein VIK14_01435 [Ignavibacteria bacterium]